MWHKGLRSMPLGLLSALAVLLLFGYREPSHPQPFRGAHPPTGVARSKAALASRAATAAIGPELSATYGKLPLVFEANNGQTDARVKFLSRGHRYTLFLTPAEAVLSLQRPKARSGTERPAVLRMRLSGANPRSDVTGVEPLAGRSNYFIGKDPGKWRAGIAQYARVRYQQVYPGIDLVYYGNQGQLEYDFVVNAGADPGAIRLAFQGAGKLEVDPRGDLLLRGKGGDVRLHKPRVYQQQGQARKSIDGRYVVSGPNEVGVLVAAYDTRQPLIIDPVLTYSTYLGGNWGDAGLAIAVDAGGTTYITGETSSADFPTANSLQNSNGGGSDVFVAKINAAGSAIVYATYLGGGANDRGQGIAIDTDGNAYVTGRTESLDFPAKNALQRHCSLDAYGMCRGDAFVTKLSADGSTLIYSTYLGGTGRDQGNAIAVDAAGSAYVTGSTLSGNFPTANALQSRYAGGSSEGDAFAAKLSADGSALVYSTYLGGTGDDAGLGIAVDSSGSAYVSGWTQSSNFPTAQPLQAALAGGTDAFIAKLQPDGSALSYATYLGGSGNDQARGIAVDPDGNAYLAGTTESTNFPTRKALQPDCQLDSAGQCQDAFVAKLVADGSALLYSTYLGGSGNDQANAIAIDTSRNVYVTGRTDSQDFPAINAFQGACSLDSQRHCLGDAFVAKVNDLGTALAYSSYLGGSGSDQGNALGVDAFGNAHVAGETRSVDFPAINSLYSSIGGVSDGFLAEIGDSSASASKKKGPLAPATLICPGGAVNWISSTDNKWTNAANWSTGVLPTPTSDVCITAGYSVVLDNGTTQTVNSITADGSLAITNGTILVAAASAINGTFNLSYGAFAGTGSLTLGGTFNWSGGRLDGVGLTTANGAVNITASAHILNNGRTLTTTAATTWTAGYIGIYDGAVLNNQGSFAVQCDQPIYYSNIAGTFNNAGTFTKSVATGNTNFNSGVVFNNTGTVNVQSGTVTLEGGGNHTGSFTVSTAGATLQFGSGAHALSTASSVSGLGNVVFYGNPVNVNGPYNVTGGTQIAGGLTNFNGVATMTSVGPLSVTSGTGNFYSQIGSLGAISVSGGTANLSTAKSYTIPTLNLSGGNLTGGDSLTISGLFTWSGGTMSGTGQTTANAGILINTNGHALDGGRVLKNVTTTTWNGGYIGIYNGSVFNNQGIFAVQCDQPFYWSTVAGTFNNAGAFTKSLTNGNTNFNSGVVFNNTGTVDVQTGTLTLEGGGTHTAGIFTVSSGAMLQFGSGAHSLSASTSVSGAGNVVLYGSPVNVNGTYNITGGTQVEGGVINFNAGSTMTSVGPLSVVSGTGNFLSQIGNLGAISVSGGTANLSTSKAYTIPTLNLSGGNLTGTDNLTVSSAFTWSGGTMSGSGQTTATAGILLNTNSHVLDGGRTLNNVTTATWTGGYIGIYNGSVFNNKLGATFAVQCDQPFYWSNVVGVFNNVGTFTKSVTNGVTTVNSGVAFNNTGTVNVQTGTLTLDGGGNQTGSFSLAAGTTFNLGGPHTLTATSSISGAGSVVLYGNPVNVNGTYAVTGGTQIANGVTNFDPGSTITAVGPLSVTYGTGNFLSPITNLGAVSVSGGTANLSTTAAYTIPSLSISGGYLAGSDNLTVSGTFMWTGGYMSGSGQTTANGGITINNSGASHHILDGGRTLTNTATATWSSGYIGIYNGSVFNNQSGANFSVQCDQPFYPSGAAGTFNNAGTFTKSSTPGDTNVNGGVAFNNSGTVQVNTGRLLLSGGGNSSGAFSVATTANLWFEGGTHNLTSAGTCVSGAGTVDFDGGTTNVSCAYNVTGNTNFTGATVNFLSTATVTATGTVSMSSGTASFGTTKVVALPVFSFSGGTVGGSDTINVNGALNWSGGSFSGTGTTNANGGISISGTTKWLDHWTLNNAGAAVWTGSNYIYVNNGGVINNLASGSFEIESDRSMQWYTGNPQPQFNNAGTVTRTVNTGAFTFDNVAFNNASTGSVSVQSGTLQLNGGGTSSGTFTVGPVAVLNFSGGAHTVTAGVSGPGQVNFNGATANMGGTYNITGGTSVSSGSVTFISTATVTALGPLAVSGGTLNFSTAKAISTSTFNLSGGTLTGPDTLTATGLFTWTGGTLSGTGTTNANGGMALNGTTKWLDNRTLNNAGAAVWTGSNYIYVNNGGVINNLASGSFEIESDRSMQWYTGNPQPQFNNAGTVTRTVNTGAFTFDNVAFNNASTGSVSVQSGTLQLNGGGTSSGTFTVGPVAVLNFSGGTHAVTAGISGAGQVNFNGATANMGGTYNFTGGTSVSSGSVTFISTATVAALGPLAVSGGTLNFSTGKAISTSTFNLSAGTLTGPDTLTASGLFTWTGGTLSGTGANPAASVTNANGGMALSGTTKWLDNRTLNNAGAAVWTGSNYIYVNNGGVINNLASGSFDVQSDGYMYWYTGTGQPVFNNAGALTKTVNTGQFAFSNVAFNNSGTVSVQAGTLVLDGGSGAASSSGSFAVTNVAALTFSRGVHNLGATASITGAGTLNFSGASATFGGTYNVTGATNVSSGLLQFGPGATPTSLGPLGISGGTLTFSSGKAISLGVVNLSGGILNGPDTITTSGLFTWTGGTAGGAGILNANGGMALSGATKWIDTRTVNNAAAAVWTGTNYIYMTNGATFNNLASGTFDVQSDGYMYWYSGSQPQFNNAGLFTRTVSSGTATFSGVNFNNSGTVSAQSGALSFSGGSGVFTQTAGSIILAGGNIATSAPLNIQGGILGGAGSITGSVVNAGQLNPGMSAGVINITGTYTQTASGSLNIELGGVTPGTQFDQLKVSGAATLGGTLNVTLINAFTPATGNTFPVLTFASSSGSFAAMNGLNLGGGAALNPSLAATALTLFVGAAANPAPALTSFSPSSVTAGATGFLLTVNGTGFVTGSVIRWNGVDLTPTNFVNGNQITTTVPATNVASAGTASVTVFNPGPGGGLSANSLTFTIDPPSSIALSLAPTAVFLVPGGSSHTINVSVPRTAYTGSVALALSGLPTGVTANISQPGTANSGSILLQAPAGTALIANQPATVTASGTGITSVTANLAVTVTQAGGAVTVGGGQGAPGGTSRVPVTLALNTGVSVDTLSFSLVLTPGAGVPNLSGLTFAPDPAMPQPAVNTGAGPNTISVAWLSTLSPALSGTVKVGEVVATLPATAVAGQSYTVQISGASSTLSGSTVSLAPGPSTTLSVTPTYMVGDASPYSGDLVGEYGNGVLNNLDLILALRAVTNVPGFLPLSCSDRFDAMDSYPVDTVTVRGGDGLLDNLDLIATLLRVTGADPLRPVRGTRGLVCVGAVAAFQPMMARDLEPRDSAAAGFEFGPPDVGPNRAGPSRASEGRATRIPLYLQAGRNLNLAALSFSLGRAAEDQAVALRFIPGDVGAPSLVDEALAGNLAVAWLNGLDLAAGQRVLLGYVEIPAGSDPAASQLRFNGGQANDRDSGRQLRLAFPGGAGRGALE